MTTREFKRFVELKKKLFGNNLFVVLDETDPEVKEYQRLLPAYFQIITNQKFQTE